MAKRDTPIGTVKRQKKTPARIALVTCKHQEQATRIATIVVERRLAACVNVLSAPVKSFYRWKGKLENAREILLIIKTTESRLVPLEYLVKELHSYDMPEFVVVSVKGGSKEYLKWLDESTSTT